MPSPTRVGLFVLAALTLAALLPACGEGTEPDQVHLEVVAGDTSPAPFVTDQGYTVELTALRVAVADLELTTEGEAHAGALLRLSDWLLPKAHAHPGHYAGGDVTGELVGRFVWGGEQGHEQSWGQATLLPGTYTGFNLSFATATEGDGVQQDDPLLGHTAWLSGVASRDGAATPFQAALDIDPGIRMVGGVFDLDVDVDTEATLVLEVLAVDPSSEEETLLDGVDFAAEGAAADGEQLTIGPGQAAHNVLRRRLQVHDHWRLRARPRQ